MIRIGITGGIGSGKSTVCKIFSELGAPVFDTDSAAKTIMSSDAGVRRRMTEIFGDAAFAGDTLNREYISSLVFKQPELLQTLNSVVHPAVADAFVCWAERQSCDYVIMECAILFESGFDSLVDRTVTVSAPEHLRIERACARDGANPDSVRRRIACQMSDGEREQKADYVINNTDMAQTAAAVAELDKIFRR